MTLVIAQGEKKRQKKTIYDRVVTKEKKVTCDNCGKLYYFNQLKKRNPSCLEHRRYCQKCLYAD